MVWRNARFVSVVDGRFDRKIQRFEGLCQVVKAPFAPLATSSTGGGAALITGKRIGSLRDPSADCDRSGITVNTHNEKPGTVPARLGGGLLALFLSRTADSIAKSNDLKGFAPS
jgi:hypothetical protein